MAVCYLLGTLYFIRTIRVGGKPPLMILFPCISVKKKRPGKDFFSSPLHLCALLWGERHKEEKDILALSVAANALPQPQWTAGDLVLCQEELGQSLCRSGRKNTWESKGRSLEREAQCWDSLLTAKWRRRCWGQRVRWGFCGASISNPIGADEHRHPCLQNTAAHPAEYVSFMWRRKLF